MAPPTKGKNQARGTKCCAVRTLALRTVTAAAAVGSALFVAGGHPHLRAGVIVTQRNSDVNVIGYIDVSAPAYNERVTYRELGAFDRTLMGSATTTVGGATLSPASDSYQNSALGFDPGSGDLLSFNASAVTNSSVGAIGTPPPDLIFGKASANSQFLLEFTITEGSYRFQFDGTLSATESASGLFRQGGAEVIMGGRDSGSTYFKWVRDVRPGRDVTEGVTTGVLEPGRYTFNAGAYTERAVDVQRGSFDGASQGNSAFDFNLTLERFEPSSEIHWAGPTPEAPSGAFGLATNWDPQQVPEKSLTRSDIAIYDKPEQYNVFLSGTRSSEKIIVSGGPAAHVTFRDGSYNVAATSFDDPGVVINGGKLSITNATLTNVHALIGSSAASHVEVTSDLFGGSSVGEWINTGSLRVGGPGEGTLEINLGGKVTSGEARIATGIAPAQATVTGAGSSWTTGNLAIGYGGEATFTVQNVGRVVSGEVHIGFSSKGTATAKGAGTSWTMTDLTVGEGGPGELLIDDQAMVNVTDIRLGQGGTGRITVSNNGRLVIGQPGVGNPAQPVIGAAGGVGQLIVESGGRVGIQNSDETFVGLDGSGSVIVRGVGQAEGFETGQSNFFNSAADQGALTVSGPESTPASLRIEDGGLVSFSLTTVGSLDGTGDVVITGRHSGGWRSEMAVQRRLTVGNHNNSRGTIDVADGAALFVGDEDLGELGVGDAIIGGAAGGTGSVVVRGSSSNGVVSAFAITQDLTIGQAGGSGALGVFGAEVHVGRDLFLGLGFNSIGRVSMHEGFLTVEGGVFVAENSRIQGTGDLSAGSVSNFGFISPGLSPGALTIDGDYEQGATGTLEIEIGGLLAETQYDRLVVTGEANVDGTLRLSFIDGFLPRTGDTFDFLEVGGLLTGEFSQFQIEGILPDWEFEFGRNGDILQLRSLNDAVAIPEPGALALLAFTLPCIIRAQISARTHRARTHRRSPN